MGFSKPPGVPCPPNNPHCQGDVLGVSIENHYLIALCVIAIIVVVYFVMHPPKKLLFFKFKNIKL